MLYRSLCAALLFNACTQAALAVPVSAITFNVDLISTTSENSTRGYAFNVTQPGVKVTHLSIWDANQDGIADSHAVGLWNPAGTLLASVLVPVGTAAALVDGFRTVDIPDLTLDVGDGYVVGATFLQGSGDWQAAGLLGLAVAPGLVYVEGRFVNGTGAGLLTRPLSATDGLPGGSFLIDGVPGVLPAPGSVALVGLALLLAAGQRRRAGF